MPEEAAPTFQESGGREKLYPRGQYGEAAPEPKNSNRVGVQKDLTFGGPYRRPADTWQERLKLAMEDPGVLAGFSHTENLPDLVGGLALNEDYVWAPLRHRMDVDRMFRAMRESNRCTKLCPCGGQTNK